MPGGGGGVGKMKGFPPSISQIMIKEWIEESTSGDSQSNP